MKKIEIFLGGGVKLLHGIDYNLKGYRNDVVDPIVSQLNSREFNTHLYVVKDYTDLTRNVVKGKQQETYNRYICKEAHIAIFIIDGEVGNITREELELAVASTKKNKHPLVFVYGKNVEEGSDLLNYLNQEGIYYQHFYDYRDLYAKIKADIDHSTKQIENKRKNTLLISTIFSLITLGVLFAIFKNFTGNDPDVLKDCTAQLYLMRYRDVNLLSNRFLFTDSILSEFKYEDSLTADSDDLMVYLVYEDTSLVETTPPFFRIKIHNKNRNTIVFIEGRLEIEYIKPLGDNGSTRFEERELDLKGFHKITISPEKNDYPLLDFRQNVEYGVTDDNYYFYLDVPMSAEIKMRVKLKSQSGEFLYSNYVILTT